MRMHEAVERIVSSFSEEERERFDSTLKKVFVDNYAAVPPESIKRLLALRDAGVLKLLALRDDYELQNEEDQVVIFANGRKNRFNIFIDARGQRPMSTEDIPFASLREALLARGQEEPDVSDDFRLMNVEGFEGLYLASLPYLMEARPFVQGITASEEIGKIVAQSTSSQRSRLRLVPYNSSEKAKGFPERKKVA